MTARSGFSVVGGAGEVLPSSIRRGRHKGAVAAFSGTTVSNPTVWKNEGYYSVGSAWEAWLSVSEPSATPPSGHVLTLVHHVLVS